MNYILNYILAPTGSKAVKKAIDITGDNAMVIEHRPNMHIDSIPYNNFILVLCNANYSKESKEDIKKLLYDLSIRGVKNGAVVQIEDELDCSTTGDLQHTIISLPLYFSATTRLLYNEDEFKPI